MRGAVMCAIADNPLAESYTSRRASGSAQCAHRYAAIAAAALAACGHAGEGGIAEPTAVHDPGPPQGFVRVEVMGVTPSPHGNALLLRSEAQDLVLPIMIGLPEATAITMRLEGRRAERPLTHDLLDAVVREMGGEIVRVLVTKLRGDVFIGTVVIRTENRILQVDARPSDAIALAVGNRAPIYVSDSLLRSAGVHWDGMR